jgi:integrase
MLITDWHFVNGHPAPVWKTKSGFTTKREALEYCATLRGEKKKERLTVRAQYEAWTATKKYDSLSVSKKTAYRIAFTKLQPIHNMDIGDVRLEDIQPIIDCAETYYPARDIRQVLSHLFKPAVIDGRAEKNYAEYIDLPPKSSPVKDAFTAEEIIRLWERYETNQFVGFILLMIYTGMAFGELRNVRCSNIDFIGHVIKDVGTKNELRKKTPIFICPYIEPVLRALYDAVNGQGRLLSMGENSFYEQYYTALDHSGCRRLTPHCCRHTTATALAQSDVHPAVIKTIMRHSKYQTTTEYTHINADAMASALGKIHPTNTALIPIVEK